MNLPITVRLRELLHTNPFHPFAIRLVDGATYAIPHEDFLSVTKSGNVIFDDGEKTYKTINAALIAEIDEKTAA